MQAKARRAVPWSWVRKQGRRWRIFPSELEKNQEVGWLVLNNPSWACESRSWILHQSWKYQPPPSFLLHPFLHDIAAPQPGGVALSRMLFSILHSQEQGMGCQCLWCQAPWPVTCCLSSSDINRMSLGPARSKYTEEAPTPPLDSVFSIHWPPATSRFSRFGATSIASNELN